MKSIKHLLEVVAMLIVGATAAHAQISLVSASVRPAGVFMPNTATNPRYSLEASRIEPLAATSSTVSNRFHLTATINRVFTDANLSGPKFRINRNPNNPVGYCNVNWIEDEIINGYRLESASSLLGPFWQDVPVQASGSTRIVNFTSGQVSAQKTQFFRLIKP